MILALAVVILAAWLFEALTGGNLLLWLWIVVGALLVLAVF